MNMHHITKSLFVGVAIAGIGMSSGRADVPLSGETRIWNLVVKDIEPLYKKKGIKLNADGLRHAITQTVLNRRPRFYEKDMYGEYDSFRSFVLHVKHAMFGLYTDSEQSCKTEMNKVALSEVMRFANGDCEKRGDIERTCPKLNFFAVARSIDDFRKYFCCNEDFPYRKVTLEQAEFIDKHFMLNSIRNGGHTYYSFRVSNFKKDEELFLTTSWHYEDGERREISDKIFSKIDSFIDTVISYRLYYQLTGLYDDTEIEQYCNPFLLSWKHEAPCSFAVVRLNFGSFGIFECIKYNGSGNLFRFKDGKLELVECLKVLSDSWKLLKELSSLVQKYQETGSLEELKKISHRL